MSVYFSYLFKLFCYLSFWYDILTLNIIGAKDRIKQKPTHATVINVNSILKTTFDHINFGVWYKAMQYNR